MQRPSDSGDERPNYRLANTWIRMPNGSRYSSTTETSICGNLQLGSSVGVRKCRGSKQLEILWTMPPNKNNFCVEFELESE